MNKRIIITEILLIAFILNLHVWSQESVTKASTNYKVERNILYRDKTAPEFTEYMSDRCHLDLYYLEQYKNFATVVWFHGGGLNEGDRFIPDQLKNQKIAVVDEFAPLFHVRADAPPLVLITGDRNLELLGRYEENAYLMRMMKVIGHKKTQLYELQGFNHGKMVEPALVLLLKHIHEVISPFPGKKTTFHSYDRYDFTFNGRKCIIVTPDITVKTKPWIWRARFFGHEPQTDIALLDKGFHVAYIDVAGLFGSPQAVSIWDKYYEYLTKNYGFDKKTVLEGMSRGGLIVYNWASKNPEKVYCIYADAPVCDIKRWPGGEGIRIRDSATWEQCLKAYGLTEEEALGAKCNPIDNLEPLAKAKVPLLHVVGDADSAVLVAENTAILEQRYRSLGGSIEVIHKPGIGHHPHSLKDPKPIVDFILKHVGLRILTKPSESADKK